MKLLVFDVGGTEMKYALTEDAVTFLYRGILPTPTESFDRFLSTVREISQKYKDEAEGIAMALPGPVDTENGLCFRNGAMRYPFPNDVAKHLKEVCGLPVILENDGRAAVLAEHRYGVLRGCQNAAVFLIGTGVGGGLVVNGQVLRGAHHTAGEFSFINTEASAYRDYGNILAHRCSTAFLLKKYQEKTGEAQPIDGREFFRRYPNDPAAKEALDELCTNVAVQLINIYWLLDVEKIAIGGGISAQPAVLEKIREKTEEVRKNSFTGKIHFPFHLEIVPCEFRNDANLIGAFVTAAERLSR
ncbi:MAG: ROK family protein [Erysipelotrichales bacterium]|nr:ROK family protein [Erysipelotrichales bacterium]